jgi:hypothetical protein
MNELLLGAFAFAADGGAAWLWRASLSAEALKSNNLPKTAES